MRTWSSWLSFLEEERDPELREVFIDYVKEQPDRSLPHEVLQQMRLSCTEREHLWSKMDDDCLAKYVEALTKQCDSLLYNVPVAYEQAIIFRAMPELLRRLRLSS